VEGMPLAVDMETAKNLEKVLPGFRNLKDRFKEEE
jgi:hypothetical protein